MIMADLHEIVSFSDTYLRTSEIQDYSGAHNGLQLENNGEVNRIAVAVDASEAVLRKAVASRADLLIVHHGMFWQGVQKISGAYYRKLKFAMDHNLAIYSSHLPLDMHPEVGNNVLLATASKVVKQEPFGDYKGFPLGVKGVFDGDLNRLLETVAQATGSPVHHCPGGSTDCGVVGIITGGAGSEIEKVKSLGIDTFITGEGPHWSYSLAEELGLNVVYAGHYATETFGVKALGDLVATSFGLKAPIYLHHPTGL